MWTAKRVVILIASLSAILGGYAVYTVFLGVIDNLQALPGRYLPGGDDPPLERRDDSTLSCDKLLEKAFGAGREELQRPIRLMFPDKGITISAGLFEIEKSDGRVRMAPFSVALFHKTKTPGGYPEISTIKADVALLTFDRPVLQFSELNNRKIVAVELQGERPGISIINNRRSAENSDDVDILITKGSLFFEDQRNLIWTDGVVRLTDYNTKPPTIIAGRGLEMNLAQDAGPNRPNNTKGRPAAKTNDNGGIERLTLRADVKMHFGIDARSGFLAGAQAPKKPLTQRPAAGADDVPIPPDKAQVHIQTGGMFVYDLLKENAWFESPLARDNVDPVAPDHVHVQRLQAVDGGKKCDQVTCDRLDLQFRNKLGSPDAEKEIETATATARPGNEVVLASDSERMAATGDFLFFRAGDAGAGPLTILKGNACRSVKDGHVMYCKELRLSGANRKGDGQAVDAVGPGKIDFLDAKSLDPHKASHTTHVLWRDKLSVVKVREGTEVFDRIDVDGNASFIDELQNQELHGDQIAVWIRQTQESAKKVQANGGGRQELHRVIAQGRVRAKSPEYIIRETNRLTLTFFPEIARDERLPGVLVEQKKGPPGAASSVVNAPPATAKKEKPRAPIELDAIEVSIRTSTFGTQKQLQELIAKGNVFVFQAGEKPGEKALDIQGQLLTLKHVNQGHNLIVSDPKKKARLEIGDIILWGPQVMVKQSENQVNIEGAGAMEMPSQTNLDGTNTTKANTRITIAWNKNMTFDGKYASFHGGVQAHQNGGYSRLLCQDMTAMLDSVVSFKEPKKGDPSQPAAKIDRIICDQKVFIDDVKIDLKKQLERRTILEGREATMNNLESTMNLAGPGRVRTLGKGSADLAGGAAPNAKPEWKLTRIDFMMRMGSRTEGKNKIATFYGDVEVQYFPSIDIQAVMNINSPPKDGLYLRCGILTVESRENEAKTTQNLIAQQDVYFRTEQYVGNADVVKYDERTDTVIFEGTNGNTVRMSQIIDGRPQQMNFNSAKVLYNRKTGKMESDGVRSLSQ